MITKYDRQKGRYVASFEMGSLALVLTKARELVESSIDGLKVAVKIDKDNSHDPLTIKVTTRDTEGGIDTIFIAKRYSQKSAILKEAQRVAKHGDNIELIRDFILGSSHKSVELH